MKTTSLSLLFLISLYALPQAGIAARSTDLKLVGKALLEFSIFKIDIYEIAYYKTKGAEELRMEYKRDVKKKHSILGWEEGLKRLLKEKKYRSKAEWIYSNTPAMKKGDVFAIRKQGDTVQFLKNEQELASVEDEALAEMVFEPWLGTPPVDQKIKNKLLGN